MTCDAVFIGSGHAANHGAFALAAAGIISIEFAQTPTERKP